MKAPDSFVPLTATPASPTPREFRVTILNGHDHSSEQTAGTAASGGDGAVKTTGFQALETQRPAAFTPNTGPEKKIGEPRVSVQRDGDRITHLRIQCSCGQVLDLACVY